uniref:NADH-plastoquinone oxidoreductase subunit 5 n=1 Tax=Centrolepis aristata TaxID=357897 RepID=UPI001F13F025|nr:NADH-plastoquinone oxidoreductase subunit 5 [Centrolepis aristata]ULQ64515.1 NADH-plastoquinone oxidoreductase subunit 5 [Centrolepis aristata]
MKHIYQYAWTIPLLPFSISILIGFGLLFIPTVIKNLRRICTFPNILLLNISIIFSFNLSIQQIKGNPIYQYLWSWVINNDFCLEFGYIIDPLTSIMPILISTVGIFVFIYSDNYMFHDQGYVRFFVYISLFNASMLGLVTSSNLIQIYFFWELVGICSYLLIGFWFTRPIAANACQKAFVTNRVGDFGLLLGILGFYWITGSFEFRDLFQISNNPIDKNGFYSLFTTLCAFLLFMGAFAKSAQFPLHIWLPDAMEGPTPISALIHAATMVAAGIFLVARLFPILITIPHISTLISLIGVITLLLGGTLALAQRDIKKSLAYSTMSQLGYMMLALGIGSYRAALFHLITHAYSKALLFLGSGSIIHSMEPIVGYSTKKNQNMILMGGLKKYIPITKISFLLGTLSLCGIPPLACFWSKDEILSDSWLHSPVLAIIAFFTAGLTAFYMFRIYLLTFDGYLHVHFQDYSSTKNNLLYSISLWGKKRFKRVKKGTLLLRVNKEVFFFTKKSFTISNTISENQNNISEKKNNIDRIQQYNNSSFANTNQYTSVYPQESDNTMLFPLILLILFTFFVGFIGIDFFQGSVHFNILQKWLTSSINENTNYSINFLDFFTNAIFSISIAIFGLFLAQILYGSTYSFLKNLDLMNSLEKINKKFLEKIKKIIYNWSYNHGYINIVYSGSFTLGIRKLTTLTIFFDKYIIDGITNGVGITSFFLGEGIKYIGGGRISSYLFFFLSYLSIFLLFFLLSK